MEGGFLVGGPGGGVQGVQFGGARKDLSVLYLPYPAAAHTTPNDQGC